MKNSDKAASIKTHVYFTMKNCNHDPERLRSGLLNIVEHYKNNHSHCSPTSRCKTNVNYISSKLPLTDVKAEAALFAFMKRLRVYKQAERYCHCMDTHYVESFNNAVLQYVDKRISFGEDSYKLRINLAILDWNEHVGRPSTSVRHIEEANNPRRKAGMPNLQKKTNTFKEEIWHRWINKMYQ